MMAILSQFKIKDDFIFDPYLALYLPLYELDGASFMSKDAYGHPCTVTGAVWRLQARYFDGTDDKTVVPNTASLQIIGDLTIELWLYRTVSADKIVLSKHGGVAHREYEIHVNSTSVIFYDGNVGGYNSAASISALPNNVWTHIVVTRTGAVGSSNTKSWFFNGSLDVQRDYGINTVASGTPDVTIGQRSGNIVPYAGLIGEARIYSRALSHLEVQHNYLATKWRYR